MRSVRTLRGFPYCSDNAGDTFYQVPQVDSYSVYSIKDTTSSYLAAIIKQGLYTYKQDIDWYMTFHFIACGFMPRCPTPNSYIPIAGIQPHQSNLYNHFFRVRQNDCYPESHRHIYIARTKFYHTLVWLINLDRNFPSKCMCVTTVKQYSATAKKILHY